MLECTSYLVMYARPLKIIKDLTDPSTGEFSLCFFIDINAPSLSHISMDIKHMPPSKDKFSYIIAIW